MRKVGKKLTEWVAYSLFSVLVVYTFALVYFGFQGVEDKPAVSFNISYEPASVLPLAAQEQNLLAERNKQQLNKHESTKTANV